MLRPVGPADHRLILAWQNQPEVWRLMDYDRTFTLDDIAALEAHARREGCPFIVELDGRPIGRIGLNRFRTRDRTCSLYVFLGEPDAWDRRLGRDAIAALLGHAFGRWDIDLVELWTLACNTRAIRAYEACGFRIDGRLRGRSLKDGERHDHLVMSLTREEHEAAARRREGARAD